MYNLELWIQNNNLSSETNPKMEFSYKVGRESSDEENVIDVLPDPKYKGIIISDLDLLADTEDDFDD